MALERLKETKYNRAESQKPVLMKRPSFGQIIANDKSVLSAKIATPQWKISSTAEPPVVEL